MAKKRTTKRTTARSKQVPLAKDAKPAKKAKKAKPRRLTRQALARERRKSPILADALLACQDEREREREEERERDADRRDFERWLRRMDEEEERKREQEAKDAKDAWGGVKASVSEEFLAGRLPTKPGVTNPKPGEHPCNRRALIWGKARKSGKSRNAAISAALNAARANAKTHIDAFKCKRPSCPKRMHLALRGVVINVTARRPYSALCAYWGVVGCPRGG